ncbi:RNA methyltransferase [Megasphaera sp.]|uniref:RNA methyltransferase n=1 Tax=Megasphaera sp. TaxID=2023260 RepID=UPI0027B9C4A3|nr:RNA methyltransferase [Megasphaera sp.]
MTKSPLYVGLVHYPIYDKNFNVITTAITNYDLHDISRSSKTYGIKKYFIIHDVPGQLDMVRKIMGFWESDTGRNYNGYRTQAFDIVDIRPSIGAAVAAVTEAEGKKPYVVTTDARTYSNTISYKALRQKREEEDTPILLLFGTGYGMTKETMEKFDFILEPIYGAGEYNHLSVRSAAAIILDRLAGEAWWT